MSDEFGFGVGDDHLRGRAKKFKAQKGKSYRIGLTWFKGIESGEFTAKNLDPETQGVESHLLTPIFKSAKRVYVDKAGYVIVDSPEIEELCNKYAPGKKIGTYVATALVSWPLDHDTGMPTAKSLFERKPEVLPWIFGMDKYNTLKKFHMKGFPLHSNDMNIELEQGKPEDFQSFQFFPAQGSIFKQMLTKASDNEDAAKIAKFVVDSTRDLLPNLETELGRRYTPDTLREALGVGGSSTTVDFGGGSSVDGADVGNLLGDMLDD